RQDKVRDFLLDRDVNFIERLAGKGPVSASRFAAQLDPDSRWIQHEATEKGEPGPVRFWPGAEASRLRSTAPRRSAVQLPPGLELRREHWQSWLFPATDPAQVGGMPAEWTTKVRAKDDETEEERLAREADELRKAREVKELLRQLKANKDAT